MSELLAIPEELALQSIAAAVAEGVNSGPDTAAARVIDRLSLSFGPVVQKIVNLITAGMTDLPAILEALQAAGVALPSWASTVVAILLAIVKPAS
jgi:hypothetical protein